MALPVMVDIEDVDCWAKYLRTKPVGATVKEAEGVLGKPATDGRKVSALIAWGIIQREGDKITLTADGRAYAMTNEEGKVKLLRKIIPKYPPYLGTLEWAAHNSIATVTSADVVARWLQYYREEVGSDNETSLNRMAVCFFYLLQGARLGSLTLGRHGMATRFDVDLNAARGLVDIGGEATDLVVAEPESSATDFGISKLPFADEDEDLALPHSSPDESTEIKQVFVGHGRNQRILEQVKELLTYGRFEPIVAEEQETTAVPVPHKVLGAMRRSQAGVINVSADEQLTDGEGNSRYPVNQNVLTEIGAAFVLYDQKVVLLTDRRVELPSNLQGLYRCEYEGNTLDFDATMKLLKALNNFRDSS